MRERSQYYIHILSYYPLSLLISHCSNLSGYDSLGCFLSRISDLQKLIPRININYCKFELFLQHVHIFNTFDHKIWLYISIFLVMQFRSHIFLFYKIHTIMDLNLCMSEYGFTSFLLSFTVFNLD